MNGSDDRMLRALLGELTNDELAGHRERLATDHAYRAEFDRLAGLRHELRGLPVRGLEQGLDVRVMAALRSQARPDALVEMMSRQFWRLALPALAGAVLLVGFALRSGQGTGSPQSVSLASWYPISTDPTASQ